MPGGRTFGHGTGVGEEAESGVEGGEPGDEVRVVEDAERDDVGVELLALREGEEGGGAGEEGGDGVEEGGGTGAEAEVRVGREGIREAALGGEGPDGIYEGIGGGFLLFLILFFPTGPVEMGERWGFRP